MKGLVGTVLVDFVARTTQFYGEMRKMGKQLNTTSMAMRRSLNLVTGAFSGLASGIAITAAVRSIADFERALAVVGAVSKATAAEMKVLEDEARRLGAQTVFSAQQAAEGMRWLAMAGYKTTEIVQAMPGMLQLAAVGMIDLGKAADIASNVVTAFGLKASDTAAVADALAVAATSANTTVEQLGEALSYAAPVAAQLGLDFRLVTATLAAFGDAGVRAERAGTGLRSVLAKIMSNTDELKRSLATAGKTVQDIDIMEQGLLKTIQELSEVDVKYLFRGLDIRAASAAAILVRVQGKIKDIFDEIRRGSGQAATMMKRMTDNLWGAFKEMTSVFNEIILQVGDRGLSKFLRGIIRHITGILRIWSGMTEKLKAEGTLTYFKRLADAIEMVGMSFLFLYTGFLPKIFKSMKLWTVGLRKVIVDFIRSPLSGLGSLISIITAYIISQWDTVIHLGGRVGTVGSLILAIWSKLRDMVVAVKDAVVDFYTGIAPKAVPSWLGKQFKEFLKEIPDLLTDMWERLNKFVSGLATSVRIIARSFILLADVLKIVVDLLKRPEVAEAAAKPESGILSFIDKIPVLGTVGRAARVAGAASAYKDELKKSLYGALQEWAEEVDTMWGGITTDILGLRDPNSLFSRLKNEILDAFERKDLAKTMAGSFAKLSPKDAAKILSGAAAVYYGGGQVAALLAGKFFPREKFKEAEEGFKALPEEIVQITDEVKKLDFQLNLLWTGLDEGAQKAYESLYDLGVIGEDLKLRPHLEEYAGYVDDLIKKQQEWVRESRIDDLRKELEQTEVVIRAISEGWEQWKVSAMEAAYSNKLIGETLEPLEGMAEAFDAWMESAERMHAADVLRNYTAQIRSVQQLTSDLKILKQATEENKITQEEFLLLQTMLQEQIQDAMRENMMLTKEWTAGVVVAMQDYAQSAMDAAQNMYTALSSTFQNIEDAFVQMVQTMKFNWSGLIDAIIADLTRVAVRGVITGPLTSWLQGVMSEGFGGFRQAGGAVRKGLSYIVGERGPELFTPRVSGRIESDFGKTVTVENVNIIMPPGAATGKGFRRHIPFVKQEMQEAFAGV